MSYNAPKYWKWDVTQLLSMSPENVKYAVLILNRPISQNQEFMENLWNNGKQHSLLSMPYYNSL